MKISIIIATYNYRDYLKQAIESILAQSLPAHECIIIDDGSTDGTEDVITQYQSQFPEANTQLIYLKQANAGPGAARNHGISLATGDFCVFLDADDMLVPDAIKIFTDFYINHGDVDVICARHQSFTQDNKVRKSKPFVLTDNKTDNFQKFLLNKQISLVNGAMAIRHEMLEHTQFAEGINNGEDISFIAHLLASRHCAAIDDFTVNIRKHDDSLRHQAGMSDELAENIKKALQIVDIIFDPNILPESLMVYAPDYRAKRLLSLFRSLYFAKQYQQARKVYHMAIRLKPKLLWRMDYFRKYLRCFARKKHEVAP